MKWPTLKGRLNQPIATRCDALKQMKANGDTLSDWAERYLEKYERTEKTRSNVEKGNPPVKAG